MRPRSDNLFHFTKNIDFLKSILRKGFLPRYCLEDTRWFDASRDFVAYPMICFCDIPISRISDHTDFYGNYGIGLTRDWGLKNKLSPVIYSGSDSAITKVIDYLVSISTKGGQDDESEEKYTEKKKVLYSLFTLIKPISGRMSVGGERVEKDFYQENEWRYIPPGTDIIFEENFQEKRDRKNSDMEIHGLSFSPSDIKYIFVRNDHEIPGLVDFINSELGGFPHNDLKLLSTRIISLETISGDL